MKAKKDKKPPPRGEKNIFRVFRENEIIIKGFLRRFTSNSHDIEDITQETIMRALHAEKTREIREPRAFLFGVARNVARKHLDKKSKSLIKYIEDFDDKEYSSHESTIDDQVDARQRMMIFWEAVTSLPPQCQKVFVLKRVYGYSHKEIAKKMGISVSTVEKHAASGLKRCSEFMEKKLGGEIVDFPKRVRENND
jgi:RNA polymerase sigma-70 factor (ECF subfamily)